MGYPERSRLLHSNHHESEIETWFHKKDTVSSCVIGTSGTTLLAASIGRRPEKKTRNTTHLLLFDLMIGLKEDLQRWEMKEFVWRYLFTYPCNAITHVRHAYTWVRLIRPSNVFILYPSPATMQNRRMKAISQCSELVLPSFVINVWFKQGKLSSGTNKSRNKDLQRSWKWNYWKQFSWTVVVKWERY